MHAISGLHNEFSLMVCETVLGSPLLIFILQAMKTGGMRVCEQGYLGQFGAFVNGGTVELWIASNLSHGHGCAPIYQNHGVHM